MNAAPIEYREGARLAEDDILPLYRANGWSSAEKPGQLLRALADSHAVVTAWHETRLVGLGNAISDGHLVVYYPHLLVLPEYQRRGIGRQIMQRMIERYRNLHQQVLLGDAAAVDFYRKLGFTQAGATQPMWIYGGKDHG